jgi:hypothetical protein
MPTSRFSSKLGRNSPSCSERLDSAIRPGEVWAFPGTEPVCVGGRLRPPCGAAFD